MNTMLFDLKNLQEIDDQISGDQKALEDGSRRLSEAAVRFKSFEDRLRVLENEREAMGARHRELEALIADLAVKIKSNESRQLAVKTDQEYSALMREAEFLQNSIGQAEDEALELLDRLEKNELAVSDQNCLLGEETGLYAKVSSEIEQAMATGRQRLDSLKSERQARLAALPSLQARQYEELLKRKAGRAVSPSADGMCLACRLSFPPQIFIELQRNEKITNCPNCGRIIYWRDHPDFKADAPAEAQKK